MAKGPDRRIERDRHSTVDRLPEDIRQEILRLRFTENLTFDEILDRLRTAAESRDDLDVPSRGALGRHLKAAKHEIDRKVDASLRELSPALQFAHQFSQALVQNIGGANPSAKAAGLRELTSTMLFEMLLKATKAANSEDPEEQAEGALSIQDVFRLSRTIVSLAHAEKIEQSTRHEAAKEADRKAERRADRKKAKADEQAAEQQQAAVDEVSTVARQRGVSADSIAQFRKFVLGEA